MALLSPNQRAVASTQGPGSGWAGVLLGLLLIGLGASLQSSETLTGNPLAHLILLLTAAALILHRAREQGPGAAAFEPDVWLAVMLAAGAAISAFSSPLSGPLRLVLVNLAIALLSLSLVSYWLGRRMAGWLAVPVLVIYVLVPVLPLFEAALSYPLRRLSAILAAGILSVGPGSVILNGTEIGWGDLRVSVTSACSGLTLLQNLIWVAWWTVLLRHCGLWTRLAHGMLVIPAVVVANTLRVIVLVVMANLFGEQTLNGPAHVVIGWLAVVLAALLFLGMEQLFPATSESMRLRPAPHG